MLKSAYNKQNPNLVFEIEKIDRESLGSTGIKEVYVGTLVDTSTDPDTRKENYKVQVQGFESDWVSTPGTMGVGAAGTISITENGVHDVANYANANVEIPSSIVNSFAVLNEKIKELYNTFYEASQNYTGATSDNITLYTPDADYKDYIIIKAKTNAPNYVIVWNKTAVGFSRELKTSNSMLRLFYLAIPNLGGMEHSMALWNTDAPHKMGIYTSSYEHYVSSYYYTVEDCLAAIKNNATTYTKTDNNTSYYDDEAYPVVYSNTFIYNNVNDNLESAQRISSNETIAVIS